MLKSIAFVAILVAACSSSPAATQADTCATPSASYLEVITQTSGNCGAVANQVVNVNADGTITLPTTVTCATNAQNGCTLNRSDCTDTVSGTTCTSNSTVTFASNGSGASGTLSETCTQGSASCASSYSITLTRQ